MLTVALSALSADYKLDHSQLSDYKETGNS